MTDKDHLSPHLSHAEVSPHSLSPLRSPHFLFFSTNHTHKRNPRTEIVLPRHVDIYPAANLRAATHLLRYPTLHTLLPLPGTSHSFTESEQKTQDILCHSPCAFLHPGAKPFSASFPHQLPAPVPIFSLFTCLKVHVLVTHHKRTLRHPVCISNSPVALSIPSSFNTLSNRSSLSSFETGKTFLLLSKQRSRLALLTRPCKLPPHAHPISIVFSSPQPHCSRMPCTHIVIAYRN